MPEEVQMQLLPMVIKKYPQTYFGGSFAVNVSDDGLELMVLVCF